MASLPEGWESDYDGKRWFFRYKSSGIIQYTFPTPGDEFPQFVDASAPPIDLAPEERLVSQLQLKRRNTTDDHSTTRTNSTRKNDVPVSATLAKGEGVGFWMEPDFLNFGDSLQDFDEEEDLTPPGDASRDTAGPAHAQTSPGQEPFQVLASPLTSAGGTPLTGNSQPAGTPEPGSLVAIPADTPQAELPARQSPLGVVAELPSEMTAQCRDETHPAPVELPGHHSVVDEPPPPVYANAFEIVPVELPATTVPAGRREQERGLDQKALSPEVEPLRISRPSTQPSPLSQPGHQAPLASTPSPGPTSQKYQAYNPSRHKPPESSPHRRPQIMSYHPDMAPQGDQPDMASKRHTLAFTQGSTPEPFVVPLVLRPPQPPPKRPLSIVEEQGASGNFGGRIPSVLQPARGRLILPHTASMPTGRRESAPKDYQAYTPQPQKESAGAGATSPEAGQLQQLKSSTSQQTFSQEQKARPLTSESRPVVMRTSTLPANMPSIIPYMGGSSQPAIMTGAPVAQPEASDLPQPLDHAHSGPATITTDTDLSAYTSQAKSSPLVVVAVDATPSPQTRPSPMADGRHSDPGGHRASTAFSILSDFSIISEPPSGPVVPPDAPPPRSGVLNDGTKGVLNSRSSLGALDSAQPAKVESYAGPSQTGLPVATSVEPRPGDRRPTMSSTLSFSINSDQPAVTSTTLHNARSPPDTAPVAGGSLDKLSASSMPSNNIPATAIYQVAENIAASQRNLATPPPQTQHPPSVQSQSPRSQVVSPPAQGQSPHSQSSISTQPVVGWQANTPSQVSPRPRTTSSSHSVTPAQILSQSVSIVEAVGPSQRMSPAQQHRMSLSHYPTQQISDSLSHDSTPVAIVATPPPRPQKEPLEPQPSFPSHSLQTDPRQGKPKTQDSQTGQNVQGVANMPPTMSPQDRRTTPRTQSAPAVDPNAQRPTAVRKQSAPLPANPVPASQNTPTMARPVSMAFGPMMTGTGQAPSVAGHPGPQASSAPGIWYTQVQGQMSQATPATMVLPQQAQQPGAGMQAGVGSSRQPAMISAMAPQYPGFPQQPVVPGQPMMNFQPGMFVMQGAQVQRQQSGQPGQPNIPAQQPSQFRPTVQQSPQKEKGSWLSSFRRSNTKKAESATQAVAGVNTQPNNLAAHQRQPSIPQGFQPQHQGMPQQMPNWAIVPGNQPAIPMQQGGRVMPPMVGQQPQWVVPPRAGLQTAPGPPSSRPLSLHGPVKVPQQDQQSHHARGTQPQPNTTAPLATVPQVRPIENQPPKNQGPQQAQSGTWQPVPPPGWTGHPTGPVGFPGATSAVGHPQTQAGQTKSAQESTTRPQPQVQDRSSWIQPSPPPSMQKLKPQQRQQSLVQGQNAQQVTGQPTQPNQGWGTPASNTPTQGGPHGQQSTVQQGHQQMTMRPAALHQHQQSLGGQAQGGQQSPPRPNGANAAANSQGSTVAAHNNANPSNSAVPSNNGWGNTSGYDGSGWGDGDDFS